MAVLIEAKRSRAEIAFDKATRSAFSDWRKNETKVFQRIDDILKDYQTNILGDLGYGGSEWNLARAEEVKRAIADARRITDARIRNLWRDEANRAAALAFMKVDGPLAALGLPVEFIKAGVSLPQLAVLQDYVPTLIQGVTYETQQRVTSLIQHAVLGGVDQREIMKKVGRSVGPLNTEMRPDHTIFSKTHVRARTIMRTEMNRLNNLAVTDRAKGLADHYPGVGLKWLHRSSPGQRTGHSALHGEIIYQANGDKFLLIGSDGTKYKVDGPHDPALPAEHSINCHCGTRVVYDSERGLKAAKDSPYIAGDGTNISSAGGVASKPSEPAKPEDRHRKIEGELSNNKFETAIAFDSRGGIVFRQKGNENSVKFSKKQVAKMKGRVVTHNHPKGSSFSPADMKLALKGELKEIRAIGKNALGEQWRHLVRFEIPDGMKRGEIFEILVEETTKAEAQTMAELISKIQSGSISIEKGNAEYWHNVWTRVSSNNSWLNYVREELV